MNKITVIDTSLSTDNIGDEIIMESVNRILYDLFPNAYFYRVPSHERLSDRSYQFLRESDFAVVGGTCLLSSRLSRRGHWRVTFKDVFHLNHAVCLGAGWQSYMDAPNLKTRMMLQRIFSSSHVHSVRDNYAYQHLSKVIPGVVNTACPTMWGLSPDHCAAIPKAKAPGALLTLTAWNADPVRDRIMIEIVQRNYRDVYFFSQMSGDYDYLSNFNLSGIKMIAPQLSVYDAFLANEDIDVIGTRLHGGIRALQKKKRSLVVTVDVRGTEIGRDTNLPVLVREQIRSLQAWIDAEAATDIRLPEAAIAQWKRQFANNEVLMAGVRTI